ncbi:MAG: threonine aldolase family protein [Acidimicrobiales bacterium]
MPNFNDTSTRPTPEMREAMRVAEVGDDVFHRDPTVNELEALGASMLGQEDALWVASGTMSNLCAILAATERGDEVLAEAESHVVYYEVGGMATVAGVMPRAIPVPDGILTADRVLPYLREPDQHYPPSSMLCVENTHNRGGGSVTDVATMAGLRQLCDEHGLHLHVDGARLFNAAVALGVPAAELGAPADSVSICLSKGLGAPVGGLLAGRSDFVARARGARKMLGGAMRQAGVVAAGGIVALRTGVDRLADDHARARRLATALTEAALPVTVDPPVTNFVMVDVSPAGRTAAGVLDELAAFGIVASSRPPATLRFVTHRDVDDGDVDALVGALEKILG